MAKIIVDVTATGSRNSASSPPFDLVTDDIHMGLRGQNTSTNRSHSFDRASSLCIYSHETLSNPIEEYCSLRI